VTTEPEEPREAGRHRRSRSTTQPTSGAPEVGARPSSGRAGRNLPAAIAVGLALGAVVLVPLLFVKPLFALIIAAAVAIAAWELSTSVARAGIKVPLIPFAAGGAGTVLVTWASGPDILPLALMVTALATIAWRLTYGVEQLQRDITITVLLLTYLPFLATFCVLLLAQPNGALRVITFMATVVCSDVGGYAFGVLRGRTPMAPSISPKKSWEGGFGSVVASAVAATLFFPLFFDAAWWRGVIFGMVVAVAAIVGDLTESMIKREIGGKDMGSLLPGHGGLMDRLDSLLLAAPAAYLLLDLFVPA
jgi:phosphatidate cytidylyltransferase